MPEPQKISLCITTYNRTELLFKSFQHIINDERIGEVVIVDDCSEENIYNEVAEYCKGFPKIKLYRNPINIDCYLNKRKAIEYAIYPYCILLDSDNIIMPDYLNRIYSYEWDDKTIFAPTYATPHFDYRKFSNDVIDKNNVAPYMNLPMFATALNTANYFVNRNFYLQCFDDKTDPHTADSMYMNYRLLLYEGRIFFVEGLQYFHLVHNGSHYQINQHKTNGFDLFVENKLKELI